MPSPMKKELTRPALQVATNMAMNMFMEPKSTDTATSTVPMSRRSTLQPSSQ